MTPGLRLPDLGRPATSEDVAKGDAIFTLEGEEVRVVELPQRALDAWWTPPGDDPIRLQGGVRGPLPAEIVQAEERLGPRGWERFYGLVHDDGVACVPAEEIEIPARDEDCWPLTGPLDATVVPPEGRCNGWNDAISDERIVIVLRLRNRSGLDVEIPAALASTVGGTYAIRPGVRFILEKANRPVESEEVDARCLTDDPPRVWTSVTARPAHDLPPPAARPLRPGEAADVARLDLRDAFAIDGAGLYRVRVVFAIRSGLGVGEPSPLFLRVKAPR